jgi:hypothetical protein
MASCVRRDVDPNGTPREIRSSIYSAYRNQHLCGRTQCYGSHRQALLQRRDGQFGEVTPLGTNQDGEQLLGCSNWPDAFDGLFDEFRIHDGILTDQQTSLPLP